MKFDELILAIDVKEHYKVAELMEILGVSQSAVISHIRRGTFKARKYMNKYYVEGKSVRDYIEGKVE